MKTALIAGASGLVGKQLLFKLLENPTYHRIIALVRKKLPIRHDKLVQMEVDFDKLYDYKYQLLGDDFFCCLGTTLKKAGSKEAFYKVDYNYCYELAKIAVENKAQNFLLVSAVGADAASTIFYSRVKGELERDIQALPIQHIHIFHPSLLVGNRLEHRLGEKLGIGLAKVVSPLLTGSLKKYKPIEATKVANALINAAQQVPNGQVKHYQFEEMISLQQ